MTVSIPTSRAVWNGFWVFVLSLSLSYDEQTGTVSCDQETYIQNMVNHWFMDDKESSDHVNSKQGQRLVSPTKIPTVCDTDLEKIPIPDKLDPDLKTLPDIRRSSVSLCCYT